MVNIVKNKNKYNQEFLNPFTFALSKILNVFVILKLKIFHYYKVGPFQEANKSY